MDKVRKLGADYRERVRVEKQHTTTFEEQRRLLDIEGPKLWEKLHEAIKSNVKLINEEAGEHALLWSEPKAYSFVVIRAHDKAALEGTYIRPIHSASFKCEKAKIDLELHQRVGSGEVYFVSINPNTQVEFVNKVEDVAYGLLQDFTTK